MLKDVVGFEDYAQVSENGDVFTKDRYVINNGTPVLIKNRKLARTNNGNNYYQVKFNINGRAYKRYVHRIVAEAFIPNPGMKTDVNHKNGDKSDNNVENLEWVTHRDNYLHATRSGLISKDKRGKWIVSSVG